MILFIFKTSKIWTTHNTNQRSNVTTTAYKHEKLSKIFFMSILKFIKKILKQTTRIDPYRTIESFDNACLSMSKHFNFVQYWNKFCHTNQFALQSLHSSYAWFLSVEIRPLWEFLAPQQYSCRPFVFPEVLLFRTKFHVSNKSCRTVLLLHYGPLIIDKNIVIQFYPYIINLITSRNVRIKNKTIILHKTVNFH